MSIDLLPFSPACERNKEAILQVLARFLPLAAAGPAGMVDPGCARVLEVGAGSGQHAVHMARHLAHVSWQPTDQASYLEGLERRIEREGRNGLAPGTRIEAPLRLEVREGPWPAGRFDLVFTANTAHIMPAAAVPHLLAGSAGVLRDGGLLLLYGPFRYGDAHTADSNAAFDAHLRQLDPAMGVRDAVALTAQARTVGLEPVDDVPMPANNRMLIFRRDGQQG